MREKLIELLNEATHIANSFCLDNECDTCEHSKNSFCLSTIEADYLIANGVTVQKNGRCKYCGDGRTFIGQSIILANDGKAHKIRYCPYCGADMRDDREA